jgi:hypothetical protein
MKLISHRGNMDGHFPDKENTKEYIDLAINKGYDVEIDLRWFDGKIFLGHDSPQYEVGKNYLLERIDNLWVHCKDRHAFEIALEYNLNCFYHNTDDYTLTSKGYVWAYPGKLSLKTNCVMVMPELHWRLDEIQKLTCYGICSDYVRLIKEK